VADRIKPPYEINPQHVPEPLFNYTKTPLPHDAEAVYGQAIRANMHTWYRRGELGWYRFFDNNVGQAHFSGIIPESRMPQSVLDGLK